MTGRQLQHHFTLSAEDSGFIYKDYLVWDKGTAPFRAQNIGKVLSKRGIEYKGNHRLGNLAPLHEPIVYLFKPYRKGGTITDCFLRDRLGCFNADMTTTNIISINSRIKDRVHETQKPTELMELLVELVTLDGHTVLDPFMGSGTTGVACVNTNRKFIGIEMDEKYFEIAIKRIEKAQEEL
jgi:site-specific DNA-methyltransferase (adenine-specific)